MLAPNLQNVHVHLLNLVMKGFQAKVLFIPIMPRLRVFKISLQEWTGHGNRPRQLRFETADATQGVKIEYGTQFPVLEKIRVGFSKMGNKGIQSRETWVEIVTLFLYGSFIPERRQFVKLFANLMWNFHKVINLG
ncbi:Tonsoku-like protein [Folsomia candida]|uniref:Tonsoku-like protein n=1 Tax=Folsomia candida TaxID=158441 RepID=A0A226DL41_FOLCA|nr:Tonsoku-like protein [Folsomia candida]